MNFYIHDLNCISWEKQTDRYTICEGIEIERITNFEGAPSGVKGR